MTRGTQNDDAATIDTTADEEVVPATKTTQRRQAVPAVVWVLLVLILAGILIAASVVATNQKKTNAVLPLNNPCDPNPCDALNEVCSREMGSFACLPRSDSPAEDESLPFKKPCVDKDIVIRRANGDVVCLDSALASAPLCEVDGICSDEEDTCVFHADTQRVYCYASSSPCAGNPCRENQYCNVFYYEDAETFPECVSVPP